MARIWTLSLQKQDHPWLNGSHFFCTGRITERPFRPLKPSWLSCCQVGTKSGPFLKSLASPKNESCYRSIPCAKIVSNIFQRMLHRTGNRNVWMSKLETLLKKYYINIINIHSTEPHPINPLQNFPMCQNSAMCQKKLHGMVNEHRHIHKLLQKGPVSK